MENTVTYLSASSYCNIPAGDRFRALLAKPGILGIPGAHNGLAALQAKAAGFEALLPLGRGDDRLDGPAGPRHHHRG